MQVIRAIVADRRDFGELTYMALQASELARSARAGGYLLVRCAPPGAADPLLPRPLFFAGADGTAGLLRLLFAPDERGLAWLANQQPGATLELIGPLGTPFTLDRQTRHLLLVGTGPTLPALLMLAHEAVHREVAVVLLAAAEQPARLPPPFLLPPAIEYQRIDESQIRDCRQPIADQDPQSAIASLQTAIQWADQLAAAAPVPLLAPLADAVRQTRLRWSRGFAQVALAGPLPCASGACLSCLVETRDGLRLGCKDGPVFDLRDVRDANH